MRILWGLLAGLASLVGFFYLVQAVITPGQFSLASASAIQATQVYTMAMYDGVIAVALFAFAVVALVALGNTRRGDEPAPAPAPLAAPAAPVVPILPAP